MGWKLEFVGVGAGFSVGLGNNNAMLYYDKPEHGFWLIDCGESTRVKLLERGLIDHLKGVIVTHLHGDHIYGLEMLGFFWRFAKHKRLRVALPSSDLIRGLWRVLRGTMSDIQDVEGGHVEATIEDFFAPMAYDPGDYMALKSGGSTLEVMFHIAEHVPGKECFGVELKVAENKFLFTSDTRIVEIDHKYGVVWHDCQLYEQGPSSVHTSIGEIETAVKSWAGDKPKIWLMHYNRTPTDDMVERAKQFSEGFVVPGQVFDLE